MNERVIFHYLPLDLAPTPRPLRVQHNRKHGYIWSHHADSQVVSESEEDIRNVSDSRMINKTEPSPWSFDFYEIFTYGDIYHVAVTRP